MNKNVAELIERHNLCIGCGFCAATCPQNAIEMYWNEKKQWIPKIILEKCAACGLCSTKCPDSPKCIAEYAKAASEKGETFGLPSQAHFFIAYDLDSKSRIKSASGGALTAVLADLLKTGKVDGIIGAVPVQASLGELHYDTTIIESIDELDKARGSHYYPLCYTKCLNKIKEKKGYYAFVGVPCVIRGVKKLPTEIQSKIRYTFSLACSHNVTGQFLDCLARQEGVPENIPFTANLRDKFGNIPDANNFNTCFHISQTAIRRNRFESEFTRMWRNYFFAQEACLYCPDFFGFDADLSVKDGWGRLSKDPLGTSLLVVRNSDLVTSIEKLKDTKKLYVAACDSSEVLFSQKQTVRFKHIESYSRFFWKRPIWNEILRNNHIMSIPWHYWAKNSFIYWYFRIMIKLSHFIYSRLKQLPPKLVIFMTLYSYIQKKLQRLKTKSKRLLFPIKNRKKLGSKTSHSGYSLPNNMQNFKVLIAGGFGYQNVGDEAQLAHVLSLWKQFCPNVELTILSPNPKYTENFHECNSELAPRVTLFNANKRAYYARSDLFFRSIYRIVKLRMLFFAFLYKHQLPPWGATDHEIHLLELIAASNVLHLSGGGYLTGMTLSRLWENMLLIQLADRLNTSVILSGQTVGVFKDKTSKELTRWGLEKVQLLYLRDSVGSIKDIESLGLTGDHIQATFDDALFCEVASDNVVNKCLLKNGIEKSCEYIVCNVHFWGQKKLQSQKLISRIAGICDYIFLTHNFRIVFIPMHSSDIPAMEEVQNKMSKDSVIIDYNYDFRIAKGIIGKAAFCITLKHHPIIFAMGSGIPTISIALDDYYARKNKGALKLFGQGHWLVDQEGLFSKSFMDKIDNMKIEKESIKEQILLKLNKIKERDGEAIKRFLAGSF